MGWSTDASTEGKATETARGRYDRNACFYDLMESPIERLRFRKWRELQWSKVAGSSILEVGVGTVKNFAYYPPGAEVTAVDFSERMLQQARRRGRKHNVSVCLRQMDVQDLEFEDSIFDAVVASFVFCSVPDAVRGLTEVKRVCKQGGRVVLLEHVLSANFILGWLMNLANPLAVRMGCENINRRTVDNVTRSGLTLEQVTDLGAGIFKLIEPRKS